MEIQQQSRLFRSEPEQLATEIEVIIDGPDPEVPNHYLARSHADAPDIDGSVRLKGKNLAGRRLRKSEGHLRQTVMIWRLGPSAKRGNE